MSKKNLFHLMTIMIVTMLSISFSSCGDDEEDNKDKGETKENTITVADPEGTIVANLVNNKTVNLSGSYDNGFLWPSISLNNSYNLYVLSYSWQVSIISVGKVNGLSSINQIPNGNWSHEVAAIPGNGYIIRSHCYDDYDQKEHNLYLRLYVVEWLKSTSGGIMGCTIKYQEFKPTNI